MCDVRRIGDPGEAGPLLRKLRREQDVTLSDVAQVLDLFETQVCAWENRVVPSLSSLIRVAWALGYDVALVRSRRPGAP